MSDTDAGELPALPLFPTHLSLCSLCLFSLLCLSLSTCIAVSSSPFLTYPILCVFQSPFLCCCLHALCLYVFFSISVSVSPIIVLCVSLTLSVFLFLPLSSLLFLPSLSPPPPIFASVSPQACGERSRSGPWKGIGWGARLESSYWEISWHRRPLPAEREGGLGGRECPPNLVCLFGPLLPRLQEARALLRGRRPRGPGGRALLRRRPPQRAPAGQTQGKNIRPSSGRGQGGGFRAR